MLFATPSILRPGFCTGQRVRSMTSDTHASGELNDPFNFYRRAGLRAKKFKVGGKIVDWLSGSSFFTFDPLTESSNSNSQSTVLLPFRLHRDCLQTRRDPPIVIHFLSRRFSQGQSDNSTFIPNPNGRLGRDKAWDLYRGCEAISSSSLANQRLLWFDSEELFK